MLRNRFLKLPVTPRWRLVTAFLLSAHLSPSIAEGVPPETVSASQTSESSLAEAWENLGRLYKDESNETLQELWVLGRYHGQYHWSEGSEGNDNGYETRRFRYGGQARLFRNLTLHAQAVSGSDLNPVFNGFTELWAQWTFAPELSLAIGQQKNRFTHDRNVSSRYLNYLERSMLTNMFGVDYTPAVTLQGKVDHLSYYTGVFSNATGKDMVDAFTDLNSGYSFLAATYYDLGTSLGTDSAYLHGTYLHSEANDRATNMNRFQNGISSALILTNGSSSLVTELTAGLGGEKGDAVGINLQPGYFLTNTLQAVTRYQAAVSDEENGLTPQRRYEKGAGLQAGDLYQAAYVGLNYYIAKHRLKLMTGIELAAMNGETVWTTSTCLRFYFGPHSGGAFPMNQMLPGHFFEYD